MTGKRIPCVLCQHEAAAFYCVNDDAHLCGSCDASVHGANPLLARHERRPLSALACQAHECASAAPSSGPCASHSTDGDAGVVPEAPQAPCAASVLPPLEPAGPMDLYEDCFLGRSLTTSDLLDFDSDLELELPGAGCAPFGAAFDPLDDCVVPDFGGPAAAAPQDAYMQSAFPYSYGAPAAYHPYAKPEQHKAASGYLVPTAAKPAAKAAAAPKAPLDPEAEAARVQRHRERQRKKRAFGRTVRYQSRRAYAEIRPRIKGRFVTPEEFAAYQAQQAALGLPVEGDAGSSGEAEAAEEAAPVAAPAPAPAAAAPKVVMPYVAAAAAPAMAESHWDEDAVVPAAASLIMC